MLACEKRTLNVSHENHTSVGPGTPVVARDYTDSRSPLTPQEPYSPLILGAPIGTLSGSRDSSASIREAEQAESGSVKPRLCRPGFLTGRFGAFIAYLTYPRGQISMKLSLVVATAFLALGVSAAVALPYTHQRQHAAYAQQQVGPTQVLQQGADTRSKPARSTKKLQKS